MGQLRWVDTDNNVLVSSVSMNSTYDIVLRDHLPVIPTACDVDYSSRRRYVCLSWQTIGRSVARRHVVAAALAAVPLQFVPSTDRRAVVQTCLLRLLLPSSPAAVTTRLNL